MISNYSYEALQPHNTPDFLILEIYFETIPLLSFFMHQYSVLVKVWWVAVMRYMRYCFYYLRFMFFNLRFIAQ